FKVMGWGDVGRLRLFSKRRFSGPEEFRTLRPWLYPESQMLKEFYKMLGATGVPLGIAEVYSGMQTGMIDTFWGTAVIASALQWHRTAKYISARGMGFISGAFAIRRAAWDALPEAARQSMIELANEERRENQIDIRRDDELSFRKLLKRGYVGIQATPEDADAWWTNGHKLRERMIGRVYTRELVDRVEDIALRYADAEQRRRFARLR
ncbi:MAG: TRAP transporter substrate-binding protein DctP, partial [Myxococcales bacterium]|nr:TRAP transporter substrate-binding protein DctP [Myxococcales bacterium]